MDNRNTTTHSSTLLIGHRTQRFSDFWFLIIKARLLWCLLVLLFARATTQEASARQVLVAIGVYFAINVALGFLSRSTLRRKRIRALPAVLDVAFTSYLIFLTGGERSVWYLLYIFPILSVSRYLSYEGSVSLALLAASFYAFAALMADGPTTLSSLILKSLILVGISFVAGNLSRTRKRKEDDLVDVFRRIDNAIIENVEIDHILKMIVESAVRFTDSSLGQISVFGEEQSPPYLVTVESHRKGLDWQVNAFATRFYSTVRQTKKPVSVLSIKQRKLAEGVDEVSPGTRAHIYILSAYVDDCRRMPRSALFVPLIVNDEVRAVIALYSEDSFHYFELDAIKLEGLAPALGITLKHSSEVEKTQRLKLLHTIGEALKVERGVSEIFQIVVQLAWNQLDSEEAALFVADGDETRIIKVAAYGPTSEVIAKLIDLEEWYRPGESLVGNIFNTKSPIHLWEVSSSILHYENYSVTLPSRQVRHYMGVPVIIGDEVLGVLRVINKRSSAYSVENVNFELADVGFGRDDMELMQTIASLVASAIRSARFIDLNHVYRVLVENSPDPIIVLDRAGRVQILNRACEIIFGYQANEVIGKAASLYYESEEHAREIGNLLRTMPHNRLQDFQARIKNRNGEIIPISLSATLLFDAHRRITGSIGIFKDLRATLILQEEKTNAEKLATLGRLAHTVGHDIKHDIAIALNYVDVLAYESRRNQELTEIYRDIQVSLGEAVDKFQNMLLVGAPNPPDKAIMGTSDLFAFVESSMHRRAKYVNVDLVVSYPPETDELEADIKNLRQVLWNLFDNSLEAIKAKRDGRSSDRGRIQCVANIVGRNLRIEWIDNGCGIPAQTLPSIFMAFFTTKPTGNGLGLFIVKNIIEGHGGQIHVESEERQGAKFIISIPLLQRGT